VSFTFNKYTSSIASLQGLETQAKPDTVNLRSASIASLQGLETFVHLLNILVWEIFNSLPPRIGNSCNDIVIMVVTPFNSLPPRIGNNPARNFLVSSVTSIASLQGLEKKKSSF